ncbi:MAG: GAF domain-containing protein, partial [Chloroflexota bacterium]
MTQLSLLSLRNHADVSNPEILLEVALSRIVAHYSTVQSAIVYRPTHEGLVVWHAENSSHDLGAFIPFEAESPHRQVIAEQNATTSQDTMTFIAPLLDKGRVFALAEFIANVPLGQEIEPLATLAEELALLLYNQLTNYLLQQQLTFTGKLTVSSSFRDLAALIGNTFLSVGQFISINQLLYSGEAMTGGKVVATANRTEGFSQNLMLELGIHSFQQLYDLLTQDGEVLVNDIPSDERLTDAERAWLQSQQIKSLYILPLWIHNRLDAFIAIADTSRALAPSALERDLLHNIIHQAAIIIEKQQLLDQSQQSVRQSAEQVRTLRLINELIANADNNQLDKPLLQKTAEVLLEVTSADHVGIVMDENGQGYLVSEAPATDMIGMEIDTGASSPYPPMSVLFSSN